MIGRERLNGLLAKRSKHLLRLLLLKVRDDRAPEELHQSLEPQQIQHTVMLVNDGMVNGRAIRGRDGN